jgi:hypothetical protein
MVQNELLNIRQISASSVKLWITVLTGDGYLTNAIKRGYDENVNGTAPRLMDGNGVVLT